MVSFYERYFNRARPKPNPELNEYQCGTYTEHSLEEAHDIAKNVIARGVGINKNDDLALNESFLNKDTT